MRLSLKSLTRPLATVLLVSGATIALGSQPSRAQQNTFVCVQSPQGVPTTAARTPRGDIPVIQWTSNWASASNWTPERRCQEVSSKFQTFHTNGSLRYLTTGRRNGYNIVCTATRSGGGCGEQLFTIQPGQNPATTLRDLEAVRNRAKGPLNQSGGGDSLDLDPIENVGGVDYLNLDVFLKTTAPLSEPGVTPEVPRRGNEPSLW